MTLTVQTFLKGLFMLIVSAAMAGLSQPVIDWAFIGMTALASILGYTGANLTGLIGNNSPAGTFSWADAGAAILVLIGTGITESLALIVVSGHIIWPVLLKVVGSVVFTYIGATLFSPPKSTSSKMFKA